MSKQAILRENVIEEMQKWGIYEPEHGAYDELANDIIALVINDMISKLQAEIKG